MATSNNVSQTMALPAEEIAFYKAMGQRLLQARKDRGLTQTELGTALGVSQQTINSFEQGRRRVTVAALPLLAQTLGVTVNDLIGESASKPKPGKRGPAPKLQQQLERLNQLSKTQQKFVSDMLDTVLEKAS